MTMPPSNHPLAVRAGLLAAVLLLAACKPVDGAKHAKAPKSAPELSAEGVAPTRGPAPEPCRIVGSDIVLPDEVTETSGVIASRHYPGVFWTFLDSGNQPVLYGFDAGGAERGRIVVTGAKNKDWESAAMGPCAGGGDCVYLGDTGDNEGRRKHVSIWRFPEPDPTADSSAPAEEIRGVYPGKGRDSEAMFVLPDGQTYLVTKGENSDVELWRFPGPLVAGSTVQLQLVRRIAPKVKQHGDRVTDASATPDGRWLAVRTYGALYLYRTQDFVRGGVDPVAVDLIPVGEAQGEGVSLGEDGSVLLTSEGTAKLPGIATRLACTLP